MKGGAVWRVHAAAAAGLGLLAAFVGPEIWQMFAAGQEDIATTKCKDLHGKINIWMMRKKTGVPDDFEELTGSLTKHDDGPFMQIEPDPWGNDYIYESPGSIHKDSFDIYSGGSDGAKGNEDDVTETSSTNATAQ